MNKKEKRNSKDPRNQNYELIGFNDNSEVLLENYKNAFNLFESEFEI